MIVGLDHISSDHRARLAIVYVRQSSPGQVRENVESTRIQLGLQEKVSKLGWPSPVVITEDLGISATGFADRPGFQELLTRVALKEVGIIVCIEAGRLSRNNKDWAHLFELCGYFNTLIADDQQIYNLSRPNDRLLLGIKGSISEMELSLLQGRLQRALEAKAARGELRVNLPAGYFYDAGDKIVFDPDQRVQRAILCMFEQFQRSTSIRQLAMWYRSTQTLFPCSRKPVSGEIHWAVPRVQTLHNLLRHPIYAGAYVWGRRSTAVEYVEGKLVKRSKETSSLEACQVCIQDHHPAYIPWAQYLENCARIAENRPRWSMQQNQGAIREGLALLAGILRCGHCGGKLYVNYKKDEAMYFCDGAEVKGSRRCLSFGSSLMDKRLEEEVCRALQPLGIKAAKAALELKEKEASKDLQWARMQVEAAEYEADRAFQQFDLCDPKNRLVADSLEERLNSKLAALKEAKEKLGEIRKENRQLSDEQRERLDELAGDFQAVWQHPQADPRLKKRLLRQVINEIIVKHEPENHRLEVILHWQGGVHTRVHVPKRARPKGNKADASLLELLQQLAEELPDAEIARILNMKDVETPRGLRWTKDRVSEFRKQHRILGAKRPPSEDRLTLKQTCAYLGISYNGLLGLVRMGAVKSNQVTDFAPWRVSRSELDSAKVQELVSVLKKTGRLPKGGCPKNQATLFDC